MNLAFMNIGSQEMMFIIVIALLLFGGKKLPELARGLGKGIREFKDASEGIKREISDQINNFEKQVDEIKTDIDKEPEQKALVSNTEDNQNENNEDNSVEKKVPSFSAPTGTYEHQPYKEPTADDYYRYGYNDHFETSTESENIESKEEVSNDLANTEKPNDNNTTEEDTTKKA